MDWFGDSAVRDRDGVPLLLYHGTRHAFDRFDPQQCGNGIHFGTLLQANNRLYGLDLDNARPQAGARIIPVYLKAAKLKRVKEQDSWSESQLLRLRDQGWDGVVYLNRREGIPLPRFQAMKRDGWIDGFGWPKIQRLSDERFRDLVPEAEDSVIVFDETQIMSAEQAWALSAPPIDRTVDTAEAAPFD